MAKFSNVFHGLIDNHPEISLSSVPLFQNLMICLARTAHPHSDKIWSLSSVL